MACIKLARQSEKKWLRHEADLSHPSNTVNKFQNIGITYVSLGTSIPLDSSWLPHNLATLAQPSETGIAHECNIGHLTSQSFSYDNTYLCWQLTAPLV
jgi:hypothetical protein